MQNLFSRLLLSGLLVASTLFAQAAPVADSSKVSFQLNGFVNTQFFYDSRQIVESREHMLSLYPKPADFDADGNDLNAVGNFNQLSMTSRLRLLINGPRMLGATPLAVIEGDFTGASNFENNSFRLREAYLRLNWDQFSVLAGQTWHPLNVPECRPSMLGLNTGAPFHPFSRHNQLRLEYRVNKITVMFVAASQRDFASSGPEGISSVYLRDALLPNLNLQAKYVGKHFLIGGTIDFKRLKPALFHMFDGAKYQSKSLVTSWSGNVFASFSKNGWTAKSAFLYGQNLSEHILLGGYYESQIDMLQHSVSYKPTSTLNGWMQIQKQLHDWRFSLFAGYTANLPYQVEQEGQFFGRGQNMASVYRLSPAVSLRLGAFELGAELEYTTAAYGKVDSKGKFTDLESYANTRVLFGASYFF